MNSAGGFAIGIDLGGTNVRVGAVRPDGCLLAQRSAPIEAARGPQAGVEKISALVAELCQQAAEGPLLAIGIGSTGPVDRVKGAIQNPYTLPTWEDVDIVTPLAGGFGVPVALENDADAAALGEAWVGAGRGFESIAQVTVGTGIGVAFIQRGKVYRGLRGLHPEGGHMLIDPGGPLDYCGGYGCWEVLASGPAMERQAREAAQREGGLLRELSGGDASRITGRMVVAAARRGDPVAQGVIAQVGRYLGLGLVNLTVTYLPDCIVLGGGVMQEYDLFAPHIRAVIDRHSLMVPANEIQILPSQLGGQAGVIGAAYAALNL